MNASRRTAHHESARGDDGDGPAGAALAALLWDLAEVEVEPALLELALTHRSFAYENGGLPHNERLEFLGDSVLGLVVTSAIFARYPDAPEGRLARLRASVVSSRSLAEIATTIGLGEHVLLGRGEESTGGREKASILADTTEAVIGAVYESGGMESATTLVLRLVDPMLRRNQALDNGLDWKTSLQELAGAGNLPLYSVTGVGPDHAKEFTATVSLDGVVVGVGQGRSKKEAEQVAARLAWTTLSQERESGTPAPAATESAATSATASDEDA